MLRSALTAKTGTAEVNLGHWNSYISALDDRSSTHGFQRPLPCHLGGFPDPRAGRHAIDAGVAAGIAINVTLPQWTGFGGVAPIIIHDAASGETKSISGLGRWPKAASIDFFNQNCGGELPPGVLRTVTPSAADAWITALKLYGTMSFEQVVTPALELAEGGFPIPATLQSALARTGDSLIGDSDGDGRWPSTAEVFFPGGRRPDIGDILVQKDLARTFHRLIEVERDHAGQGREAALQAARDFFYKGEIAEEIVRFVQSEGGLLTMEDMAEFGVGIDTPPSIDYKGIEVFACGPWCQGPMNLHTLKILEGFDLRGLGHNTAAYAHTVIEVLKLAFSDREAYYGDPDFVDVPIAGLLSNSYAEERRGAIDRSRAAPEMPLAGDPWPHQGMPARNGHPARPDLVAGGLPADTSYASVSWLDPQHPSALVPGKRPRLTPNPALAMRNGKPLMPFGTPGGDVQPQSMVQLFLNVVEFGMDVQQAVEAPRFSTWSFPNSFWPHAYHPGLVGVEGRMDSNVVSELSRLGHKVEVWDDFTPRMGCLCAVQVDQQRGGLSGGADPRRDGYAMGR
ncbi:Glutathione hydrolase-like YwrD proenzyme [Geodia barretti]|uniref:Glutathione hydrolase-like YwrD proenzyme n=1 Tax=Geodia barretti TaxID=519541 RepID=A0AA35TFF1_GEOBA|nr:Glutathione hydrolase-like YwrD proenzyme [Geodia barretti]